MTGEPSTESPVPVALTRSPGFWLTIRYALLFGVVLAFASLAFLAVTKAGGTWFTLPKTPGWLDGSLWWVAVTAAAGVLVGLLRRRFRLPAKLPGTIKEMKDERVEPAHVPGGVAVSVMSLIGGASLGPEAALGMLGGGLGTWVSERRKLDEQTRSTNTLSGMSGAYGGLLAAPYIATMLVLELARPKGERLADNIASGLIASTVSFAIFFPIAGATFLGIYTLPAYRYADWQLLAAIPLGLLGGLLALVTIVVIGAVSKLVSPLAHRTVLLATLGGVAFGLVGVALPLTLFTGSSALRTVIADGATLGAGLLIAVLFAKIIVFAICEATGFIGGPFFPLLFIGGTAGVTLHELIPGLPVGLAFATLFAAVPAALVGAPFALILLSVLTTQVGTLQTAPIAIAVLVAYLAVAGSGTLTALARRGHKTS